MEELYSVLDTALLGPNISMEWSRFSEDLAGTEGRKIKY